MATKKGGYKRLLKEKVLNGEPLTAYEKRTLERYASRVRENNQRVSRGHRATAESNGLSVALEFVTRLWPILSSDGGQSSKERK